MTTQSPPASMYRSTEGLGQWAHKGKVAAVGIGHSPTYRRWDGSPEHSVGANSILALRRAIEDAGVSPDQIDGLVIDPITTTGAHWPEGTPIPMDVVNAYNQTDDPLDGIAKLSAEWLLKNMPELSNVKFTMYGTGCMSHSIVVAAQASVVVGIVIVAVVGVAAVAGVQLGLMAHTLLAVVGLSVVIASSTVLFTLIAVVGALYIAWLGIQGIRSGVVRVSGTADPGVSHAKVLRDAVLTNLFNPKVILLFLALMPNFVDLPRGGIAGQPGTLGITLIIVNTLWQLPLALGADGMLLATRMIVASEIWSHDDYKRRIIEMGPADTRIIMSIFGDNSRVIDTPDSARVAELERDGVDDFEAYRPLVQGTRQREAYETGDCKWRVLWSSEGGSWDEIVREKDLVACNEDADQL